jgi:hypothetical protein
MPSFCLVVFFHFLSIFYLSRTLSLSLFLYRPLLSLSHLLCLSHSLSLSHSHQALARIKRDDNLKGWFENLANEIGALEFERPTTTGRKITHLMQVWGLVSLKGVCVCVCMWAEY